MNELTFDLHILHRVCNNIVHQGLKVTMGQVLWISKDGSGFDPQICFFYTVRQKKGTNFLLCASF